MRSYWLRSSRAEAIPVLERLDPEHVIDALVARDSPSGFVCRWPMRSSAKMTPRLRAGDVVAILSNGGFGGIYEKLPKRD